MRNKHDSEQIIEDGLREIRRKYFESVKAVAETVIDEAGDDEDRINELVDELVENSQYVIYTHLNLHVLLASQKDDALFDEVGKEKLAGVDSVNDLYARLAFYAMREDVNETIAELEDEDEDEDEKEED